MNMDKLVEFVKNLEGCKLKEYKDSVGVRTIGVGHTGKDVYDGMEITQQEADELLKKDLQYFINIIEKYVKVPLTENQKIALVSFVFNIGEGNFKRSSVLLLINQGNYNGGCEHMALWNRGGIYVLKGLVNRREKEMNLFKS